MERNIAALMREDCRTVHVELAPEGYRFEDEIPQWVSQDEDMNNLYSQKGLLSPMRTPKSPPKKLYTYVTDLPLRVGDFVVVLANSMPQIALVQKVDDTTNIEPNSSIEYLWVVCKVDTAHYNKTMAQNLKITKAVSKAYKENLRRGFSQQVLLGMPEDQRTELEKLIRKA